MSLSSRLVGFWLRGEHVAVDLLLTYLGTKQKYYLTLITRILGLVYSLILTWQGGVYALREFTHHSEFPVTTWLPVWPAVSIIFFGSVFLCVAFYHDHL